jgi:protein TonB
MASLALTSQDKNKTKDKALALIITLIIHGALLLFLLLYIIITPIPPFPPPPNAPELELNLGASGGGSSTPASQSASESKTPQKITNPSTNNPTVNSNVEASAPVPSANSTKIPKKIDSVVKPQQPSVALANAENKFKNAKGSPGSNTAQGEPGSGTGGNGTGQKGGTGPGTGSGPGGMGSGGKDWSLSGRQLITRPKLVTNNPEQGQIVVQITVDQDGNVTDATPGALGTTIMDDPSLYVLVKNAALKTKFNKSSEDLPEQTGTITFKFVIQ